LAQAALPGDKVVLALEPGVPQAAEIVERTVAAIVAGGVAARDITLLRTLSDVDAADPLAELPREIRREIVSARHDPTTRERLSYLAASSNGRPIYINRAIHDADLVISIGCLRLKESLGYYGINTSVFPTFSDAATIRRYHSTKAARAPGRKRLRTEATEVGWLLGARFTIQVVPGAGQEILHILAGDLVAVRREGGRFCDEAWRYWIPGRAGLVVATIEGDSSQQTWQHLGRALAAAARAVEPGGAVAICTELAERPGPALQRIIGADDLDAALKQIDRDRSPEALAAGELVRALHRGKVFLVSRLDDELVEDLGMLPLAADQLARLIGRYESCILLANAHRALARPRVKPRTISKRKSPK
jgi:nickel-dependent lactate racemase